MRVRSGDGAHQVDAAVELDEASTIEPCPDLPGPDPGRQELGPRDDPVLACRQPRDQEIDRSNVGFRSYADYNPTLIALAPRLDPGEPPVVLRRADPFARYAGARYAGSSTTTGITRPPARSA